jgi:hypothetical protein
MATEKKKNLIKFLDDWVAVMSHEKTSEIKLRKETGTFTLVS